MNNLQSPQTATPYNGNGNTTFWYQPIQTVHNSIVIPEIENRQNIPEFLKMNNADSLKLLTLISDWRMSFLFRTLYDALVDVEALKYITPIQCDMLLSNYPLGIRIKFVGKLMEWKQTTSAEVANNNSTSLPPFPNVFL